MYRYHLFFTTQILDDRKSRQRPFTKKRLHDESPQKIASYCCYGMPYRKNTFFWISRTLEKWEPLLCDKNCDAMGLNEKGRLVHLCSAQKGRSRAIWSTDRDFKTQDLYIIPSGLVESIYVAINSYGVGDSVY